MTVYLREATASQEVPLGQMLSTADGLTAYTTPIAVTDIHIWKAGGTTLAHKSTGASVHISDGVHYITLDATDTDTPGPLVIFSQPTGALATRQECIVLKANIYDSWFSTDLQDVSLVQVNGAAQTATLDTIKAETVLIVEDTGTTIPGTITTIDGIVDDILTDTGTTLDALIKRVLGMNQENFRISSPTFTGVNMTGCTVKIYPTATDCTNDTNVLATYTITATYDGNGNLATYKSIKA